MIKPSQLNKPADMSWRQYRATAEALDRQSGHEAYSTVALFQLLDHACARLAKAHLEAPSTRLMLPKTIMLARSKAPARTGATGFSRSRSSPEVQQAVARRLALR